MAKKDPIYCPNDILRGEEKIIIEYIAGFLAFFNRNYQYYLLGTHKGWFSYMPWTVKDSFGNETDGHVFRVGALIQSCQPCQAGWVQV